MEKGLEVIPGDNIKRCFIYCSRGSDIIKADFMHIKRTTFPTKMKTGILLEELK